MLKIKGLTQKNSNSVVLLCITTFVVVVNQTILSPAIPSIMNEFSISADESQWLITVFMLVSALIMPLSALFLSNFKLRNLFSFSIIIYSFGSFIIFISPYFIFVIIGRVLQAISAGIITPATVSFLYIVYPKEKRGSAAGFYGIVTGIAPACAPAIAGFVINIISWRYLFLFVALFSLMCFIFCLNVLENKKLLKIKNLKADFISIILSFSGFGITLYALSSIGSKNFYVTNFIFLLVGIILIVMFIYRQLHSSASILDLKLLKNKKFKLSTVLYIIVNSNGMCNALFIPILVQNICGQSPAVSGLILTPGAIAAVILNPIIGKYFDKNGPRNLCIFGCAVICLTSFCMAFSNLDMNMIVFSIILTFRSVALLMYGRGASTWGINSIKKSEIPHGNAISSSFMYVASSFFTAIFVSFFCLSQNWIDTLIVQVDGDMLLTQLFAIDFIFLIQGIICFVCLIFSFKIK